MKLLDILSGYTSTSGSPLVHFAYIGACGLFTLGIVEMETADESFLELINDWFWVHSSIFFCIIFSNTMFVNHSELRFTAMLAAIFFYQTMILITTIAHISHCLQYKLHFFYVEDLVHFLLFSELMIFCANFITNVIVLLIASLVDIKNVKPN